MRKITWKSIPYFYYLLWMENSDLNIKHTYRELQTYKLLHSSHPILQNILATGTELACILVFGFFKLN